MRVFFSQNMEYFSFCTKVLATFFDSNEWRCYRVFIVPKVFFNRSFCAKCEPGKYLAKCFYCRCDFAEVLLYGTGFYQVECGYNGFICGYSANKISRTVTALIKTQL